MSSVLCDLSTLPLRFGLRDLIDMPNTQVLHMPVKLCLKLVAIVCPDGMDAKGKFSYHVVDESDSVFLGMVIVYL